MTPYYDPLLAKLCVHGTDRAAALDLAASAVAAFAVSGLKTNLPFHADLLAIGGVPQRRLRHVPGRAVCARKPPRGDHDGAEQGDS